jgi:lipopolysaccharide transport system permease protein
MMNSTVFSTVRMIVQQRHLIWTLVVRDLKSRYAGSAMGLFWAVINPLILLAVFSFVFATIFKQRVASGGEQSFFLFMFCGLWPWIAFQEGVSRSSYAMIENAHFIKKVVFPSEVLVISTVLSSFVQLLIGFALFFALLIVSGQMGNVLYLTLLPVAFLLQLALTLGLGWALSSLTVFFRDIAQVVNALLMVWFYTTPIVYPESLVPAGFKFLLIVNPMHHLLSIYRALILGGRLPGPESVLYVVVIAGISFWLGSRLFGHLKGTFADLL